MIKIKTKKIITKLWIVKLIEKYKEQNKYVKFNINSLSYMKNVMYEKWLNIFRWKELTKE